MAHPSATKEIAEFKGFISGFNMYFVRGIPFQIYTIASTRLNGRAGLLCSCCVCCATHKTTNGAFWISLIEYKCLITNDEMFYLFFEIRQSFEIRCCATATAVILCHFSGSKSIFVNPKTSITFLSESTL